MSRMGRLALAWGIRRALRGPRRGAPAAFASGVCVGAGLVYLLARSPRRAPRRQQRATAPPR
jgi:hypothetical protein